MSGDKPKISSLGERCCGCGACAAACPHGCVAMEPDALGFRYPGVDAAACVGCGLCERACPALRGRGGDGCEAVRWARAKDGGVLARSSSGGVFGLLAEDVLARGGAVYGAAFSGGCETVRHVRVGSAGGLDGVMRSKYVQSEVGAEVYRGVEADLRAGVPVLFCGTACQVAGLRSYLDVRRAPADGLLLADVVCHGVPSPELWRRWLGHRARCARGEVHSVNFRSKITGWLSYSVLYEYRTEKDSASRSSANKFADDWYMRAFLANASLRPSCFGCPAKRACGSDITLGDFWGVQRCHPGVPVEGGVSAVIVNTERGAAAFDRVSGSLSYGESSFRNVVRGNPALVSSMQAAACRDEFMQAVEGGMPIPDMMGKWSFEAPLPQRCISFGKRVAKRLLGRM